MAARGTRRKRGPIRVLSFAIHRHRSLASTSDAARALAADGAPDGTVVVADEQTAGRGRQGRRWNSPPGNLYASIVLRPTVATARSAELGFVAGVAVAEALAGLLASGPAVALKWPNDVLAGGAKIAGLLVEREENAAILGIGVNVAHHPLGTPYPATDLAAAGAVVPVDTVRDRVLAALAATMALWETGGFAPIRAAWLDRAHPPGTALTARLGDGTLRAGCFAGIGPDGALLLDTGEGRVRIVAGEVAG